MHWQTPIQSCMNPESILNWIKVLALMDSINSTELKQGNFSKQFQMIDLQMQKESFKILKDSCIDPTENFGINLFKKLIPRNWNRETFPFNLMISRKILQQSLLKILSISQNPDGSLMEILQTATWTSKNPAESQIKPQVKQVSTEQNRTHQKKRQRIQKNPKHPTKSRRIFDKDPSN